VEKYYLNINIIIIIVIVIIFYYYFDLKQWIQHIHNVGMENKDVYPNNSRPLLQTQITSVTQASN
jgi:hypothetical protein